jgi:hypothetical protein
MKQVLLTIVQSQSLKEEEKKALETFLFTIMKHSSGYYDLKLLILVFQRFVGPC